MGRRTILLIVAALVAVVGSGMVFLYVKGADDRAMQLQEPVKVLKAVAQIDPGETLADASAAGKIQLLDVPMEQRLEGAMTTIGDSGQLVALTRIFPNEQITASKFGSPGEQDTLIMPPGKFAVSVNLSDTGRVSGFVSPGSEVALFLTGPTGSNGEEGTRRAAPEGAGHRRRPDDDDEHDHHHRRGQRRPSRACRSRCSRSPWTRTRPRRSCTPPRTASSASVCSTTSPR